MLEFLSCVTCVNPGRVATAAAAAVNPGRYWDNENRPAGTVPELNAAAYCEEEEYGMIRMKFTCARCYNRGRPVWLLPDGQRQR